jgi:hypothetical protein
MTKPVTPQEMFDLWQKMVNPGAYPLQSLMFPVLDPKELERKIAELATIEHWLRANLSMLQLTIQSLEFQKGMLEGGEKVAGAMHGEGPPDDIPNPAMWAWNRMAEAARARQPADPPARPKARARRRKSG